MAAIAHLGVGLAAKRIAPRTNVGILIAAAYGIDLVWGVFFALGLESMPDAEVVLTNAYSHGLFMALVWSLLGGLAAWGISRSRRSGLIIGLLVFSHWVVDFISHPMTAVYPADLPLPLLFDGSPTVGLGLWRTTTLVNIGEFGTLLVGLAIYLLTLRSLRRAQASAQPAPEAA